MAGVEYQNPRLSVKDCTGLGRSARQEIDHKQTFAMNSNELAMKNARHQARFPWSSRYDQ